MIDHDALFKILLKTCFVEFLELFFPEMCIYLDKRSIEFLDKEFFTGIASDKRREADLVAKAKFADKETFFLINLEGQGNPEKDFFARLFFYFAHLHQETRLPIYTIAVFYGDKPKKPYPDTYRIEFPDHVMLEFRPRLVQLIRLNWRSFINHPNPIAAALMARMNIATEDRPYAKLECLRMIATAKISARKTRVLTSFVDAYLQLNSVEQEIFQREVAKIEPRRRTKIMELTTSWKEEGIKQGLQQGMQQGLQQGSQQEALHLALRLLNRRLGSVSQRLSKRIKKLSLTQLEDLSEAAMCDFKDVRDVNQWLDARGV